MQTHPIASLAGLKEELLAMPDVTGAQAMIFAMIVSRTGTEGWHVRLGPTTGRMYTSIEEAVRGLLVLAAMHGHHIICGRDLRPRALCSLPPYHEGDCDPGPKSKLPWT